MGTFYVSKQHNEDWLQYVSNGTIPPWWEKFNDNMIVRGGAAWLEDKAVSDSTLDWINCSISYFAVGDSTDTNAGQYGPHHGAISASGPWQGPSSLDYRLSNEIGRQSVDYIRQGDQLVIKTVLTQTDLTFSAGKAYVREMGLFLSDTPPTQTPFESTDDVTNAMVVRSVRYSTSASMYVDNPIFVTASYPIELFYIMRVS